MSTSEALMWLGEGATLAVFIWAAIDAVWRSRQ